MKYFLMCLLLLLGFNAEAQVRQNELKSSARQDNLQQVQDSQVQRMRRSYINMGGDQRKALNLLVLQEVATYKLGDERLKKEIDGLKNNRSYYDKLDKIKKKLSNGKISNTNNQEIMRILNDAGNRIYNLLGN